MKINTFLKPNRIALLIAALYAPAVFASVAARVEFSTGDAVLLSSDGKERPVKKGDALAPGERIRTRSGRVQLAFTDGAFVSLQPETDFGVDQYQFQGKTDGTEKGFFSMLKGSLRTITGLIGRGKRDAYRIQTPTATIGIRGTGGLIQVSDDGTSVLGTSGTWTLSNNAGSIDVPAGTTGFAGASGDSPPQTGGATPSVPPEGGAGSGIAAQGSFAYGEQVDSSGVPLALAGQIGAMADGPGYTVYHVSNLEPNILEGSANSLATFNGSGLSSFQAGGVSQGTTVLANAGNDGVIGWGRWSGAGAYDANGDTNVLTANQSLHYVVGMPTAVMPTTGSATYNLIGATQPTESTGTWAPGVLNSASLSVDFPSYSLILGVDLTINANSYILTGSGSFSGSTFTDIPISGTYSGKASGAFFGAEAARAGMVYSIIDGSSTINGSAAFAK